MCGWFSCEMALASLSKRALRSGAIGKVLGKNLDGYGAVEARVRGLVNLAHASGAYRREDLIRAEAGSGGEAHSYPYYVVRNLSA